jgi:hypothetical protein
MGSLFFITIEVREGCEHLTKEPAQRLHRGLSSIHIHYKPVSVSGLEETLRSGEGLVTEITGPGEVCIQTKNIREMAEWIWTIIEPRVQAKAR